MGPGGDGTFSSGYAEVKVEHPGGFGHWAARARGHGPAMELSIELKTRAAPGCWEDAEGGEKGRGRVQGAPEF